MVSAVADTHAALWYLFDDLRLSEFAGTFMDDAAKTQRQIAVSSISLAEVVYLVEKRRVIEAAYEVLAEALANPEHVFVEAPLNAAVVRAMHRVSRAEVPDLPDRVVAATAVHLNVPVISRDRMIRAASLKTIW